jgi:glycosyltransferase involved in cell wall biosynthesis
VRICGVIASLGAGGAERVMLELCAAWAARGDEVTLLTLDDGSQDFYALPAGVHRRPLALASVSASAFDAVRSNLRRIRTLEEAIRVAAADVVVSFTDQTNVLTLLATRGMAVPVIVSERTDPRRHDIGHAWRLLRRRTYPRAAAVVVQTERLRPWAERHVTSSHVHVIGNPLRTSHADPVAMHLRHHLIVAMGRCVPSKGFDMLVRAVGTLHASFPDWRLVIHGDGPGREALQSLIVSLGVAHVITLPGRTTHTDVALEQASVFCLPSRYEGFPNVLLEAMSHGCACVATDCDSGPAELLMDGEVGALVPVDDITALTTSLAHLMRSVDVRTELGARARASCSRFALTAILEAWDAVFSSVLQPVSRRRAA